MVSQLIHHYFTKFKGKMFNPHFTLFLLLVQFQQLAALFGRRQTAGVKGTLLCDGKPATDVLLKLYDDDTGPDLDDLLAKGFTDSNGDFLLYGSTDELTDIDPKLNIYHDCHDSLMPCQRKFSIMLPDRFVFDGEKPQKFYDIGAIELSGEFKDESRDCLHRR